MNNVKVMISLPEGLLDEIDRAAADQHASRSAFLREAAQSYIAHRAGRRVPGDDPAIRAADEAIRALAERTAPAVDQNSLEILRRLRQRHDRPDTPDLDG